MDSNDEEDNFPTAELDDPVWSEEPVSSSHQQLCIHQIWCHTSRPATLPYNSFKKYPQSQNKWILEIPDDQPDIINVPKELLSDFDSWAHIVLNYQW